MSIFINSYSWSGKINDRPMRGEGETRTNTTTGIIEARGQLQGVDSGYRIAHTGLSVYCISCSNSLGVGVATQSIQGKSIVDFTGGRYITQRKINHVVNGKVVGISVIRGRAQLESSNSLKLDVDVQCNYRGPANILRVSDYVLPLKVGVGRAFGRYVQYLHSDSEQIINFVECEYLWDAAAAPSSSASQQNFGIFFREITDEFISSDIRDIGFKAQGNNLLALDDITPEQFAESLSHHT